MAAPDSGTALWTAAHYHIPALLLVVNNQSYYNDEEHQERVARTRGRPVENRWLGLLRMTDPEVDFGRAGVSRGTARPGISAHEPPLGCPAAHASSARLY